MANKRLSAIISIGGAVAASLKNAIGQTQAGIGRIGEAVAKLEARQRELNNVVAQQGKLGASASALKVQYAQQELAIIDKQVAKLKQLQATEARIAAARKANAANRAEIGGKIGSTVAGGTVAALPFLGAMKKAVEFEYQQQLIGNTANMTAAEIGELTAKIMESSKETNQSAVNTQKAIGFLVAAGMETKLAAQMMTVVGKSATATGGDIEDMAKAVFTLNDSLKIQPGQMMQALDTLAVAGKEGNVELKDMAKQLPVLASGFVSLKMEGREAAATMGAALEIARKGAADADEAANNMKNFIAKIMSPETLKKAKKNFNLDLYKIISDAQKKGENPFEASMMAIMKATKGDQKAIGELFQDMQVQNFLRPMIQQWDKYKEIKAKALQGDGTVDRDFVKVMATSKEQIDKVGGALQRFFITLGGVLSKTFGGKGGLAERIDGVTKWISANGELVGTIAKVAVGFFGLRLAVLGAKYAFTLVRGAILAGRAAMLAMGLSLAPIALPLAAVGAALLVAGLIMRKYWEPASAWLSGVGEGLMNVLGKAGPLGDTFRAVGNAVGVVWDWFTKLLEPIHSTKKELDEAKASGVAFGEALAAGFEIAFKPLSMLISGIKWVMGATKSVVQAGKNISTGSVGANMLQYDAMGNPTGFAPPEDSTLPKPAPAGSSKPASVVNDNSQTTFNIAPPAGTSVKEIADEVDARMKRREAERRSSRMYDGANQ